MKDYIVTLPDTYYNNYIRQNPCDTGSGLQKNVFPVLQFVLSVGMRLEGLDANTLNIVMSAERGWTKNERD